MGTGFKKKTAALLTVVVLLSSVVVELPAVRAAKAPSVGRAAHPNFVLFLADDLDQTTSPYWDAMPQTKRLLAERGVTFTNAFAPTPVCCPARSSLLTGKYGHNTGVLTNDGPQGGMETFIKYGNEERTFAKYLQKAGYRTGLVGKYLNGLEEQPTHIPIGWDEWYAGVTTSFYTGYDYTLNENGTMVEYGNDEDDYATDVVTRKAVEFISRSAIDSRSGETQPFFLYLAPTAPHLPLGPAPRHAQNPYVDAVVPKRPNYYELNLSDKPAWLRLSGIPRLKWIWWQDIDYRNRMGSLYALDDMVAATVKELERTGQLDNTYLIFTSDNGYNLGAHRLLHKQVPYEESARVPMVVAGPGIRRGIEGRWATQIDVAPTVLELAGVSVPDDVDGRSLVPVLRGRPTPDWRNEFLVQYVTGGAYPHLLPLLNAVAIILLGQEIPSYRAIRRDNWLYVEWYEDRLLTLHDYELYDLGTDPYQLRNRLATVDGWMWNLRTVRFLRQRLDALSTCSGASCRN